MSTIISRLRHCYKPGRIKVLFVAESPPEPGDDEEPRFFYNPEQERWDYLYRAVMEAAFPEFNYRPREKNDWLRKFKERGYYLIDATDQAVNGLSPAERRHALEAAVNPTLSRIARLVSPDTRIVLVKKNVFRTFIEPLRHAGYNVIHKSVLPFPSHGHQKEFVKKCRACLRKARGELADESEAAEIRRNAAGNYPAVETMRVMLAQKLIRARRAAGLTQAQLAKRAGVRTETVSRLEAGKNSPNVATVDKIHRALEQAGKKRTPR